MGLEPQPDTSQGTRFESILPGVLSVARDDDDGDHPLANNMLSNRAEQPFTDSGLCGAYHDNERRVQTTGQVKDGFCRLVTDLDRKLHAIKSKRSQLVGFRLQVGLKIVKLTLDYLIIGFGISR